MTKEQIIIDNVKSLAVIAYNLNCMAKDSNCYDQKAYADAAEDAINNLIEYIKEETA